MKVLGCFKIVPDLEQLADEDWIADENLRMDTGYVKPQWNCFDESALEMMLKLSDLSEGFDVVMELSALTIGEKKHEVFLRTLYALGYKQAVRIEKTGEHMTPEYVAEIIAQYINKDRQDVVLLGTQSADQSHGKTPFLLAEYLGWPCISQVINIEPEDEKYLKVTHETDQGTEEIIVQTPCVLSVGNATSSYLRVPTLKAKMSLGKQPIIQFEAEECKFENPVILTGLEKVQYKRESVIIDGETPEKKAEILYEEYLKGRLKAL